jgi:protease I
VRRLTGCFCGKATIAQALGVAIEDLIKYDDIVLLIGGPMKKSQKKAVILTADKFEDLELFFPLFRLLEAGWQVDVAAPKKTKIDGEHGYSITPQKTIDEVNPDEYDLLIIPGGFPDGAPATVRKIQKALEITKSFFEKNKPVASICHGPWTLASADVVKGRHLTSYWHDGVPEDIQKAGGVWEDKEVVVDGNLVTARWPMDLPAFMREVMNKVEKLK